MSRAHAARGAIVSMLLAFGANAANAPVVPAPVPAAPAPAASAPPVAKGPGGDPRPSAAAGESLGRIDLTLAKNLILVDATPRTLDRALTATPTPSVDVSALPAGEWLHASMPLTKSESVALAVSRDRQILFFDSDRDGRLETGERFAPDSVFGNIAWFAVHAPIRQESAGRVHEHDVALKVGVLLRTDVLRSRLDCYRSGTFSGPTRKVKIAIEDRTFRGWFTHPGLDALLVDVDGNGTFDASADSTERYRLGEPFPLDGMDAVITSIAPLGASVEIARSVKPARRIAALNIGAAAPTFEVHSLDGRTWKLEALRGKWVLLDFWATWCGPCRTEIPNLKRAHDEHSDLVVLGLSADRSRGALEQFVKAQALPWPQVLEEAAPVQRLYRVASYPTSFLVDPDGRIAARDLRGESLSAQIAQLKAARKGGKPAKAGITTPTSERSK